MTDISYAKLGYDQVMMMMMMMVDDDDDDDDGSDGDGSLQLFKNHRLVIVKPMEIVIQRW